MHTSGTAGITYRYVYSCSAIGSTMMMMAETQRRMAGHDLRLGMMIPISPVRTTSPNTGPGRKMMCWYSFMRTAGTCTTRVPKW